MKDDEVVIRIHQGTAEFIYQDSLRDLLKAGPSSIRRVSHVEPEGLEWKATMEDGTVLGPFETREEALDAEIEYLKKEMMK